MTGDSNDMLNTDMEFVKDECTLILFILISMGGKIELSTYNICCEFSSCCSFKVFFVGVILWSNTELFFYKNMSIEVN